MAPDEWEDEPPLPIIPKPEAPSGYEEPPSPKKKKKKDSIDETKIHIPLPPIVDEKATIVSAEMLHAIA